MQLRKRTGSFPGAALGRSLRHGVRTTAAEEQGAARAPLLREGPCIPGYKHTDLQQNGEGVSGEGTMAGAGLDRDLSPYTLCAFCMWNRADIAFRTQAPVNLGEHVGRSPACASSVSAWEST